MAAISLSTLLSVVAGVLIGFAIWWFAWSAVLRWLRVLWVCRVPAASAGLGLALFGLAEPARDLFMETQDFAVYWIGFFGLLLIWAIGVHFVSRKVLDQQAWAARGTALPLDHERLDKLRKRYLAPATWVPRILGALCLVAIALGMWGAQRDVAPVSVALEDPFFAKLPWGLVITCVLYVVYVFFRRRLFSAAERRKPFATYLKEQWDGDSRTLIGEPNPFWILGLITAGGRNARAYRRDGNLNGDYLAIAFLGLLTGLWLIAIFAPLTFAHEISRAQFVVMMLGLPVPFIGFLSTLSHRWRVPVVLLVGFALAALTGLDERFHDLRVETQNLPPLQQTPLAKAVEAWKAANCSGEPCKARPVIIATSGGASRAGFYTATVMGEMIDLAPEIRTRLFAFSGVSGGSVGAAMVRAALADPTAQPGPPCKRLDTQWFGPSWDYVPTGKQPIRWRQCLQALLAGDFLSPAFIGLAFRDPFGFALADHADRAALLEESFERRYAFLADPKDARPSGGLRAFVGAVRPPGAATWTPLLLLNTTTVTDGRRLVVSDLFPHVDRDGTCGRFAPRAYDLFETIAHAPGDCQAPALDRGVRLSTGAAASARFPVVSPQAGVRGTDGTLRTQLVDGGYFENDGITTARQLAQALRASGLEPVLVQITNAPASDPAKPADAIFLPVAPVPTWYDTFTAPLSALLDTGSGHAAEAMQRAATEGIPLIAFQVFDRIPLLKAGEPCAFDGPAGTFDDALPKMTDLSMSWWLSGTVQGYLDRQLCHPRNQKSYRALKAVVNGETTEPLLQRPQ